MPRTNGLRTALAILCLLIMRQTVLHDYLSTVLPSHIILPDKKSLFNGFDTQAVFLICA
jgi:hypothetical protein